MTSRAVPWAAALLAGAALALVAVVMLVSAARAAEPIEVRIRHSAFLPAGSTRLTTLTWDRPGTYRFVCHLPGHEAYGMVGTITVRP